MCAVMIESTPASIAAWNGGMSVARHSASERPMFGRPVWLSVAASPWPGKCLAEEDTVRLGRSPSW
jgi:hypothetical protein